MEEASLNNERQLLEKIASGDEVAFTSLVKKYNNLVFVFINNIVRDTEMAEEMVNDIFTQVWLARESLRSIRNIHTYLFVISRNYALNGIRNRLREKRRLQNLPDLADDDLYIEQKHLALNLIDAAIEELPLQRQKIWILSRREGKSYQEIELQLNISRNTIKTQLQKANRSITDYVLKRMDMGLMLWWLLK